TASDGTGLLLESVTARAVLEGPLAFTELRLAFANPQPRVLEGRFKIALPQSASVSRFAMRVGDAWQEGEVVERQTARAAYEDFLHRKRDPALLEQSAANEFGARVFPIPPHATKEILISYAEELRGGAPYVLSLQGMPKLGAVDVRVSASASNAPLFTLHEVDWEPVRDVVVDRSTFAAGDGLRSGELVVARVHPVIDSQPDPMGAAVVLLDTSASRALGFEAQLQALQSLATELAGTTADATWTIGCFDQSVAEVYSGPLHAFGRDALDRIRARRPLGASDVSRALTWAGRRAKETRAKRVLVISDGVPTAGETDRLRLASAARDLAMSGVVRLDAIAVGGIRDDALLRAMAASGLDHDGVVLGLDQGPDVIAARLGKSTRSGIAVKVEGARWWHPTKIDGAQAGDEILVYADVPDSAAVRVSLDGAPGKALDLRPVERPLLERAWAQSKIASLLDEQDAVADKAALRAQVVALSTTHRIISPYTALLVLETERDYARFHIDRSALTDILAIEGSRVALAHRKGVAFDPTAPIRPAAVDDLASSPPTEAVPMVRAAPQPALGVDPSGADKREADRPAEVAPESTGALGLSGIGRGEGIGNGRGRLGGGHMVQPPKMREGTVVVTGQTPHEVIEHIVRQNFGRFRLCYENGMRNNPNLGGHVVIAFVIDATGQVTRAWADRSSNLPDTNVVQCIVRGFGTLAFPTSGDTVTVVYPLAFGPGDAPLAPFAVAPAVRQAPPPRPAVDQASSPPLEATSASRPPYDGAFADVMLAIEHHDVTRAVQKAWTAREHDPGDVTALVALGEALEASGDAVTAGRAYGSIIDLFPSSADMRRMAGERLERIHDGAALDLAADAYAKAVENRPDHPSGHRLLAMARLRQHDYQGAFDAAIAGLAHPYPQGRFAGVDRILREDLGLIGAAWAAAEPSRRDDIDTRVRAAGGTIENAPSLRFVLNWESDANDVDLHVRDSAGDHAFYGHPTLASGGNLYADVTTGYGPECFTTRAPKSARPARYEIQVHYYARGPMGYGMGKVEVVDHDGHGKLTFSERPFVVMNDHAFVELGTY
ncbi:MAG: AgmX/PglI C-terminal domain-containing protein, partial [Polyangiaceae bacterium]|nr:AgmX/PglI C-terminal domain-containing protein [Polyangiaceae bacterium]